MQWKSKVSPAIFALSILCFLLPFVTISCNGKKLSSFSGVQLATGTTIEQPQMFGPPQKKRANPEPAATVAAICALLALGLSFLGARMALGTAIGGAMGTVSLLLMKAQLDDRIAKQGQGMLQVDYETGFALALALLMGGAAWNAYLFWQKKKAAVKDLPATSPPAAQTGSSGSKSPGPASSPPGSSQPERGAEPAQALSGRPDESHSVRTVARFCPNCGVEISGSANFCENCGKPVVTRASGEHA
jgi:hypothetical protein